MIENIKDFILLSTDFIHQTLQVDYKGKSVLESVGRTRKCLSRTEYLDRIFGQDIWTGYLDRIFGQDIWPDIWTGYLDRIFGQDIWTGYLDRKFGQDIWTGSP